ncbi:hypothetical protein EVG20_g7041 [Dentipellis fragilis]|uniref:Uncharacterized protein n=1 Tax=Dentipellis fragilis TaxID=205917 RepID=A0A4Y9YG11_9AGAM|nr:hypothetical protein EVG20_g7041 [Dentipellis fragilis]
MSLDQNLFTLTIAPQADDPAFVDLADASGTVHYRKQRVPGTAYHINVYEPLSEALLASASAPGATSKHKTIELFNPSLSVPLDSVGTLSFKWAFSWEGHDFEWKREECYMLRKPDPAVLVALTKEPPGKLKTTAVQILDYNLNRFDIADRKGLEIVILTALLTFHDLNETYHVPADTSSASTAPGQPPATGVDRVAEIQAMRGEVNEITVEDECDVDDWAAYAANLLEDDAMLFITVRSAAAVQVPKVLQVVEQTKRIRHKRGLPSELHQYVLYDTQQQTPSPPRRIKLDDPPPGAASVPAVAGYSPPQSLVVHLSKISIPELQPRTKADVDRGGSIMDRTRMRAHSPPGKDKEQEKEREKEKRKDKGKGKASPPSNKTHRPTQSHSHSPSPAQLNNPSLYVAPPPPGSSSISMGSLFGRKKR